MSDSDVRYLIDNLLSLKTEIKEIKSMLVSKAMDDDPIKWVTRRQAAMLLGVSMATIDRRKYKRNEYGEILRSDLVGKG